MLEDLLRKNRGYRRYYEDVAIRYWRDDHGIHHVPKRPLTDLLFQRK